MFPGQNGMLASEVNFVADTRIVETAAGIGFGLAVSQGVNDKGCIIGGANFVGITRADPTLPQAAGLTVIDTYAQNDNAGILKEGDIWVNCYASVNPTTAVTFSATTGQLGLAGTTITNARWMTTAVGSSGTPALAVLRVSNIAGK
jgi:hypothetical protein